MSKSVRFGTDYDKKGYEMGKSKDNIYVIYISVVSIVIFGIWFVVNALGCSTKVELPDSCLDDKSWFVIEMCKSKKEICFDTDRGVKCVERF